MDWPHRFDHAICAACWNKQNLGGLATSADRVDPELCCFCGERTTDGIYVRRDPKAPELKCTNYAAYAHPQPLGGDF